MKVQPDDVGADAEEDVTGFGADMLALMQMSDGRLAQSESEDP